MRIVHAVTLVSPDAAYGGPTRVALNQLSALRGEGNDALLVAGVRGYDPHPTELEDVPLRGFRARNFLPRRGFVGMAAPESIRWLVRSRHEIDVMHFHLARDLVMLPLVHATKALGIPYVVQTHGMIAPRARRAGKMFDAAFVRSLLGNAGSVFYLTDAERAGLLQIAGETDLDLVHLPNGVPLYEPAAEVASRRSDERSGGLEVLYLARLHERKNPMDFVDAGLRLSAEGAQASFTLVGPDEGEGAKIAKAIRTEPSVSWEGPIESGTGPERMRRASVYVLPSIGEPYPMSVLEAMSVGLPVIITSDCGLADVVGSSGCGIVIEPGADHVASAVRRLLDSPDERREMGLRGRRVVAERFAMESIAAQLMSRYERAVG